MLGPKGATGHKFAPPPDHASDSDEDPNDAASCSSPNSIKNHQPSDSGIILPLGTFLGNFPTSSEVFNRREADAVLRISNGTMKCSGESYRVDTNAEYDSEVKELSSNEICSSFGTLPTDAHSASTGTQKRRREILDCVLIPPRTQNSKRPKIENDEDIRDVAGTMSSTMSLMRNSNADEDYKKMKLWQNNKAKKKKNELVLLPETIRSRIKHIGFDIQEQYFTIDKLMREVMVTRAFMSNVYGGSPQVAFPRIGKKKLENHGMNDFMFMNTEFQPQAPEVPGAPGLWFNPNENGGIGRFRAFTKINSGNPNNKWLYVGQYEVCLANPSRLSMQEWRAQPAALQNTWANAIAYKGWGDWVCARILARKLYGREPDDEECEELIRNGRYRETTVDEVKAAYYSGKELMVVWTMKCIGYDNRFQKEISERYPTWVPPPPKKRKGKGPLEEDVDEEEGV